MTDDNNTTISNNNLNILDKAFIEYGKDNLNNHNVVYDDESDKDYIDEKDFITKVGDDPMYKDRPRGITSIKSFYQNNIGEIKFLLSWTWPILISNLSFFVIFNFVNLTFIGHVGKVELAAVALGNTWQIATSSFALGAPAAMDTLISQAFGAKQYRLIGNTVQTAFLIAVVINVLISLLWIKTGEFLTLCGQDIVISELARQYSLFMIPGLWFGSFFSVLSKYLQAQGLMTPPIVVGIIANIFNIILNYIFVFGVGELTSFGVIGSAMSTSISKTIGFFILLIWIKVFKLHQTPIKTWYGLSRDAFSWKGIKEYIVLCIPSGLQLLFETWGFEILTIMAGLLSATSLDAHSITVNFNLINIMLPYSLSVAASIRIGQMVGAGKANNARKSVLVSLLITTIIIILGVTFQLVSRNYVGMVYSDDVQVQQLVALLVPLSALSKIFDGYQVNCYGILRAVGKNSLGAIIHFGSFYLIGLPLAGALTFANVIPPLYHTVYALWWGLNGGLLVCSIFSAWVVYRIDWDEEVINASERTDSYLNVDNGDEIDEDKNLLQDKECEDESKDSGSTLMEEVDSDFILK